MSAQPALPKLIERAKVPAYFPLFRNAAALAHLAHTGQGPPYILVGGKAWYDVADIAAWIEKKKVRGQPAEDEGAKRGYLAPRRTKKRGRPTKKEQYYRRLRENADD